LKTNRFFQIRALWTALPALVLLTACGENQYVAPPPPRVTVALPVQQPVVRYFETTGTAAAINSANLVARVQGYLQEIKYKDGEGVKKGTPLFVIEPEPYQVKLEQAKAAQTGSVAVSKQSDAEYGRQADLVSRQVSTQANYDKALADRDNNRAKVEQAQTDTKTAEINLSYTTVNAPFDGVVTARQVSIGELVGASGPTTLATIVQLNPIWVNFNVGERDVLTSRKIMEERKITINDIVGKMAVEVGLQTDKGFPHKGTIDYIAPTVSTSTGTLAVRGVFPNPDRNILPGYFVRVRFALIPDPVPSLLVPDAAVGSDQSGRYVLVVGADNVVEQRKVVLGPVVGELRVIDEGLKPDDKVVVGGALRAVPGQKVDPQTAPNTPAVK